MATGKNITYAISGVFGMNQLLEALLDELKADARGRDAEPAFIFLGDIVGMGPESSEALSVVRATLKAFPGSALVLGDGDLLFRRFLSGELTDMELLDFSRKGMTQIFASYPKFARLPPGSLKKGRLYAAMREYILTAHPDHFELLKSARKSVDIDGYVFVHAGLRPGVPIADQSEIDLTTIQEDFLNFTGQFEKFVVHAHTPNDSDLPEVYGNRIAVDTEAFETSRLNALALHPGEEPRFISAFGEGLVNAVRYCGNPVIERRSLSDSRIETIRESGVKMVSQSEREFGHRYVHPSTKAQMDAYRMNQKSTGQG